MGAEERPYTFGGGPEPWELALGDDDPDAEAPDFRSYGGSVHERGSHTGGPYDTPVEIEEAVLRDSEVLEVLEVLERNVLNRVRLRQAPPVCQRRQVPHQGGSDDHIGGIQSAEPRV